MVLSDGGKYPSLAPGVKTTFTGSYTIEWADVANGAIINTAEVSGTPPNGQAVTDQDSDHQTLSEDPQLGLSISGTPNLDVVYPDKHRADAGDTITYTFTVKNTGNVPLKDVTLRSLVSGVTFNSTTIDSLDPDPNKPENSTTFTGTYILTQEDIDNGEFTNIVEVSGTSPSGQTATTQASHTQALQAEPAITLTKTGEVDVGVKSPYNIANPGDPIRYNFTIENNGNVTLTNILLDDSGAVILAPSPPIPGIEVTRDTNGNTTAKITSLVPGAKVTINGYKVILVDDFRNGTYKNTATVTGTSPSGQTVTTQASHTETLVAKPAIALNMTGALNAGSNNRADAGDTLDYTFTITNTGNVALTDINLTDSANGVVGQITSLEPDDSVIITGTYILLQEDIDRGFFTNSSEVKGKFAYSQNVEEVTAQASHTQDLEAKPAIALNMTGSLNAGSNNRADAGDTLGYTFTITNTGNVTLTNVTLTNLVQGVTVSGGPIASLDPDKSDSTTFTASYTLTQADVDSGSFTNRAQVTGTPPNTSDVMDEIEITTSLASVPFIGAAKRVTGSPVEVSTGVWDVPFEIRVKNYSNVTLSELQVIEDLNTTFPIHTLDKVYASNPPLPAVASFSVQSVTSTDFTQNPQFNGKADQKLLAGTDVLAPGEEGTVQFVVRVTPITGGPFENSVTVSAVTPSQKTVEDHSHNGSNPDPDNDGDPTNNHTPTPVNFGTLFQPPVGEKRATTPDDGMAQWTLEWMNNANIQPLPVMVYDPIPQDTTYHSSGSSSGYPLPTGQLPTGSTTTGVTCIAASTATKTTACYYEGPTTAFPRGRVIWQGILAADYQAADLQSATHKISIRFNTRVNDSAEQIHNVATAGADLNGDGIISGMGELSASAAAANWKRPAELPQTGFAPGIVSQLPLQPAEKAYQQTNELRLEIPALDVNVPVVGVPLTDGQWDVTWLGANAGHLAGTSFPTWQGNAVITAHVYDANGLPGPFVNLNQLKWGDKILLHAFGNVYEYEVRTTRRVQPRDLSIMETQKGSWVTLITCQSYDEASNTYRYRFAVQAVLLQVRPAGQ